MELRHAFNIRTLLSSSIYFVNQNQQFYNTIVHQYICMAKKQKKKKSMEINLFYYDMV